MAGLLPLGVQSALAANDAYSTNASSGLFSNSFTLNTTTPVAGGTSAPASGDALYFGAATTTTVNNDLVGYTYAGFTFNTGAAAFTIGGNAFTLSGSIVNNSTSAQIINNAITLAAQQTITSNTGAITLGGIISGTGFGLTKTGTGLLTLSGANTYSGPTTITGILNAANNSALGTGAVTVNGGAAGNQLQLANGVNVSNALTLAGGGATGQGALYVPTGNATYSGTINITGATSSGGFFASGGGLLNIAGDNTITSTLPVTVRSGFVKYLGAQSYTTGTTLANTTAAILFAKTVSMPATGTVALSTGTTLAVNVGGAGEFTLGVGTNTAGTVGGLLSGVGGQGLRSLLRLAHRSASTPRILRALRHITPLLLRRTTPVWQNWEPAPLS